MIDLPDWDQCKIGANGARKCPLCGCHFRTPAGLNRHFLANHGPVRPTLRKSEISPAPQQVLKPVGGNTPPPKAKQQKTMIQMMEEQNQMMMALWQQKMMAQALAEGPTKPHEQPNSLMETIKVIKAVKELEFGGGGDEISTDVWADIAQQALPLVGELVRKKLGKPTSQTATDSASPTKAQTVVDDVPYTIVTAEDLEEQPKTAFREAIQNERRNETVEDEESDIETGEGSSEGETPGVYDGDGGEDVTRRENQDSGA